MNYKRYYKVLLNKMDTGDEVFRDPMKGELSYTNIGHSVGDWLWAYRDGGKFIKKEVLSGRETHFSLGLMYGYDFFGRYDKKRNAVTVTNLGDGEEVPEELIRILKYEFGNGIKIKQFKE